jgi:hypothetical protein
MRISSLGCQCDRGGGTRCDAIAASGAVDNTQDWHRKPTETRLEPNCASSAGVSTGLADNTYASETNIADRSALVTDLGLLRIAPAQQKISSCRAAAHAHGQFSLMILR